MCEAELKAKYEALVQGRTTLESCLHTNLSEHINSEIGLGTIRDIDSAKKWLHNSFLFQRIQQNPKHYAIGKAGDQTWQERIDEMVTESVHKLQESELVVASDTDMSQLTSTDYGDIMSKVGTFILSFCLMTLKGSHAVLHSSIDGKLVDYFAVTKKDLNHLTDEQYLETARSCEFERNGTSFNRLEWTLSNHTSLKLDMLSTAEEYVSFLTSCSR